MSTSHLSMNDLIISNNEIEVLTGIEAIEKIPLEKSSEMDIEYIISCENIPINNKIPYLIESFLRKKREKSANTESNYRRSIILFFQKSISDITLADITSVKYQNVKVFLTSMIEYKKYKPSTIYNYTSALSSLYDNLMKYNSNNDHQQLNINYNPFKNLRDEKPNLICSETDFLNEKEMKSLLGHINENSDHIIDIRDKIMISIALTTALRKSDILKIKIQDIKQIGEFYIINIPVVQKTKNHHSVKLQYKIKLLIDKYLAATNRTYENDGTKYLFLGKKNIDGTTIMNKNSFNYILKKRLKNAHLRTNIKVHGLRHSAITDLLQKENVTLDEVRQIANHKNVNTTLRYSHNKVPLKNNPIDKIDIL